MVVQKRRHGPLLALVCIPSTRRPPATTDPEHFHLGGHIVGGGRVRRAPNDGYSSVSERRIFEQGAIPERWCPWRDTLDVRAFMILVAAVLASVGAGVGVLSGASNRSGDGLDWACSTASSSRSPNPVDVPVWPVQQLCFGPDMPTTFRGGNPDQVRIGVRDRGTNAVHVGPVVMAINALSDTRLVAAYGPGSMWLYAAITTQGPLALRIADATGAVVQSVRMPELSHAVGIADHSGLWIRDIDQGAAMKKTVVFHVAIDSGRVIELRNQPLNATGDWFPPASG